MRKKITPEILHKEVRRLDASLKPGSRDHETYLILLSSLTCGPNIKRIANFLGISRQKVAERSRRLRKNGVWSGPRLRCVWFEKHGGIAFVMDAAVADGLMQRRHPAAQP